MRKLTRSLLSLLLLAFVLSSCGAQLVQTSYKSLAISKTTYESTLTLAGDLYKQGIMTEDQKDKVIEYGNIYKAIHNEAVAAVLKYKSSNLAEDEDAYLILVAEVASRLVNLIDYIKPFILKEVR